MISSKHRFVLDLHSTQSQVSVPATQYDSARELYISLSDGGMPYIIEEGILASLQIKRPSGEAITGFCTIEKNTTIKFAFEQNPAVTVEEGIHDCSVILANGENIIASARFSMVVSARVIDSDDINISDADKNILDAYLQKVASYDAAETGRANAEKERKDNEDQRKIDEDIRKLASEEAVKNANDAADRANEVADLLQEKLESTNYYTKSETDTKIDERISAAITAALNTEV